MNENGQETGAEEHKRAGVKGLVICAAILVVAVAVYIGCFMASLSSVRAQALEIELDAARVELAVNELDVAEVADASAALDTAVDSLEAELNAWPWALARIIPTYGEDVENAKKLVSITKTLTSRVLAPVSESAAQVSDTAREDGLVALVESGSVSSFAEELEDAAPYVRAASEDLSNLADFHIDELNGAVDSLRQSIEPLVQALDTYESAKSNIEGALESVLG